MWNKPLHSPDNFPFYVYEKGDDLSENTLNSAQLETRCPLDNGRHDCTSTSTCPPTNQLDRLPLELITEVLLRMDIPSLTRFRVVSRRAMEIVNSVRQYSAIIKHCPNIIRAIISIQADAFDCCTLYRTLSTSRCSTCNRFGFYLYLIDCRRVCYLCFTTYPEFFPLTTRGASKFFTRTPNTPRNIKSSRQLLEWVNPPSILSLPGRYSRHSLNTRRVGIFEAKRIRLYDRRAVAGSGLPKSDRFNRESKRFMAIISAPVLLDGGRQVDQGFFCLGCREEKGEKGKHFRIKYTTEELPEHIARYGPVKRDSYLDPKHVPKTR